MAKQATEEVLLLNWDKHASPYYDGSHHRWRQHMKQFVDKEVLPYVDKWEKAEKVPKEFYKKAYDAGVYSMDYPAKYGGTPWENKKMDPFHKIIFYEQITRAGSGGLMTGVWVHFIAIPPVIHFGNEFQKNLFKPVIMGDQLSCLAISEPNAGSDVRNLQCTAKRDGDDYIVNGEKYWISGAMVADWFVTAVRTGKEGIGGLSLMMIPRSKGVFTSKLPLQGHATGQTAYVVFRNCRVPAKYLIGEENKGFKMIMFNFNQERFGIACGATACCRVLVDESVRYAKSRKTFGKPLIKHQVIRHKLAEMARLGLATFALMERCAYQMKTDPLGMKDKSLARNIALFKVQSTKALEFCAREASQIFGGRSYIRGGRAAKIDRIYRDVRAYAIYGGSEEIMLDLAVRQAKL